MVHCEFSNEEVEVDEVERGKRVGVLGEKGAARVVVAKKASERKAVVRCILREAEGVDRERYGCERRV